MTPTCGPLLRAYNRRRGRDVLQKGCRLWSLLAILWVPLTTTSCGGGSSSQLPDTAPFPYFNETLYFPEGTVDARTEQSAFHGVVSEKQGGRFSGSTNGYARLLPDAPQTGDANFRYFVELGRHTTGSNLYGSYWIGFSYPPGSPRTAIGDGYVMYCPPSQMQVRSAGCAVLLRSLPLAALQFVERPATSILALAIVNEAEGYLTRAKGSFRRKPSDVLSMKLNKFVPQNQ